MKIILTQDVKKLGKKGGIIEVSDGYARNYILPQKLGVEANSKNLNDLKLQKSNEEKTMQRLLEEAQALAEKIGKQTVVVSMKAGEGGKVFGSVSSKEIAAAIKAQSDLEIDKKKIQLSEPIRSFGVHEAGIKLHPQVTATLRVKVEEA
ncbi:MAG: 50S ribosomal protein L9 [Lachnospiraceae bacterium]|jgi:large subunit ribosomal protein L9|nr:50S ribosomal protein L9 [Lachnospiraceae bacterium]